MAMSRRRRTTGAGQTIAGQIQQLVQERDELKVQVATLTADLEAIRSALGRVGTQAAAGGRGGRRSAGSATLVAPPPERRKRRPITDPEILARRNAALAKARAARAERLAAARAAEQGGVAQPAEPAGVEA